MLHKIPKTARSLVSRFLYFFLIIDIFKNEKIDDLLAINLNLLVYPLYKHFNLPFYLHLYVLSTPRN